MFKTSNGKYIAPQVVENKYKESPFIDNVMVVGDGRNYCTALIAPDFEHLESWCKIKGHFFEGPESAVKNEVIINRIQREITKLNLHLDKVEQVKIFTLIANNWSVETGELSPTLKLRRKELIHKYKLVIDNLYSKT